MFTRVVTGLVIGLLLLGGPGAVVPALAAAGGHSAGGHGAEGAEAEGGEVGINPLEFQKDLAIWTAVIFLLLMAILWKFAWGPIADGLGKREQRIADEIASAERSNAEARQLLEQYEERLAATGQEVQEMIQAARQDAERVGGQIVDKAKAEAEVEHQRAIGEIELATTNALKELAERSASLAVGLAGRIVRSELDPKAHSHLIEQAMTDFSQKQAGNGGGPSGG